MRVLPGSRRPPLIWTFSLFRDGMRASERGFFFACARFGRSLHLWQFAWICCDTRRRASSKLISKCSGLLCLFFSFDQLRIGDPLAFCCGEKRVDAITFLGVAPIIAPREFVKVAVEMFCANEMMDAEHLPLKVRPCAFQPVDVTEVVADVLAEAMVDRMVMEPTFQANVARELIAHNVGAGFDVFNNLTLNGLRRQVIEIHREEITAAFQHAEHGGLADPASAGVLLLPFVFIALFAADEGFVDST